MLLRQYHLGELRLLMRVWQEVKVVAGGMSSIKDRIVVSQGEQKCREISFLISNVVPIWRFWNRIWPKPYLVFVWDFDFDFLLWFGGKEHFLKALNLLSPFYLLTIS